MLASDKQAAIDQNQDTIVSVVTIGEGTSPRVGVEVVNSNVQVLNPIPETSYRADAYGTQLFESVFVLC